MGTREISLLLRSRNVYVGVDNLPKAFFDNQAITVLILKFSFITVRHDMLPPTCANVLTIDIASSVFLLANVAFVIGAFA